jgi:hypothetical protein
MKSKVFLAGELWEQLSDHATRDGPPIQVDRQLSGGSVLFRSASRPGSYLLAYGRPRLALAGKNKKTVRENS